MNHVLDIMGENEQHPLAGLLEFLALMVSSYDKEHYSIEKL
jgi:HTH-type transcriptional regulator/antitoxin HigA